MIALGLAVMISAYQAAGGTSTDQDERFTLKTAHYTVTVTNRCSPYDMHCKRVTYHSESNAGQSITLQGYVDFRPCSYDYRVPCEFRGYFFENGDYTYQVSRPDDPEPWLRVTRKDKQTHKHEEILRETGEVLNLP